jgi:tetratricopeptide (TPR) repeat protein
LRDKAKLDIGRKDIFKILVIADEREIGIENTPVNPDEKRTNKGHTNKIDTLVRKLGNERKEKRKRLTQLFPDLKQPIGQIDPRKEAESSKHLILSRKAYYNNDLNTALNEVIESINVNPYASKSYEMLGSIYYRLKWRNLALNNWEKALALDPDNKKLNKFIDKIKTEL